MHPYTGNSLATSEDEQMRDLIDRLAALSVGTGVGFPEVSQLLKKAFVEAAAMVVNVGSNPRDRSSVSRLSAATGLNRRAVTEILQAGTASHGPRETLSEKVRKRWCEELSKPGQWSRKIPKSGEPVSFESLARSVTTDVHPRTVLMEMTRLSMVRYDSKPGVVTLLS